MCVLTPNVYLRAIFNSNWFLVAVAAYLSLKHKANRQLPPPRPGLLDKGFLWPHPGQARPPAGGPESSAPASGQVVKYSRWCKNHSIYNDFEAMGTKTTVFTMNLKPLVQKPQYLQWILNRWCKNHSIYNEFEVAGANTTVFTMISLPEARPPR